MKFPITNSFFIDLQIARRKHLFVSSAACLVMISTGYAYFIDKPTAETPSKNPQQIQPEQPQPDSAPKPEAETTPKPNAASPSPSAPQLPPAQPSGGGKYSQHTVIASLYGIGEDADKSNDYISNVPSAWSSNAVIDFGGKDPLDGIRNFTPKHNPFYFALPAIEFNDAGLVPGAREKSPWAAEAAKLAGNQSLFKSRWAKVTRTVNGQTKTVYAQWQDVGPNEEQDYSYVFGNGTQKPRNTFGVHAGIDLSPDAAHALGFGLSEGSATVTWSFIDASIVPAGPWRNSPSLDNIIRW